MKKREQNNLSHIDYNRLSVNMYSLCYHLFKSYGKENNIICESVH